MNSTEQSNGLKMGHFKLLPLVGGQTTTCVNRSKPRHCHSNEDAVIYIAGTHMNTVMSFSTISIGTTTIPASWWFSKLYCWEAIKFHQKLWLHTYCPPSVTHNWRSIPTIQCLLSTTHFQPSTIKRLPYTSYRPPLKVCSTIHNLSSTINCVSSTVNSLPSLVYCLPYHPPSIVHFLSSTVHCLSSSIHWEQSPVYHEQPTIHSPSSIVNHPLFSIHCLPSNLYHPPATVYHPSTVFHPSITIYYPPSTVYHYRLPSITFKKNEFIMK